MSAADMSRVVPATILSKDVSVTLTHEHLHRIVMQHVMSSRDAFGIPQWIDRKFDVEIVYHVSDNKVTHVTYTISNSK